MHSESDLALMGIRIELEVEPDDMPLKGNVCATGDDAADAEQEREVAERLGRGDWWAWCYVRVTATWTAPSGATYTGSDSLGGCSYASEQDFRADAYYTDLLEVAVHHLREAIADRVRAGRKATRDLRSFPLPLPKTR